MMPHLNYHKKSKIRQFISEKRELHHKRVVEKQKLNDFSKYRKQLQDKFNSIQKEINKKEKV